MVITAPIRMNAINCHLCTDSHYNRWLKINHPEVLKLNEEATFSDIDPSGSTAKLTTEGKDLELNSYFEGATPDMRALNATSNPSCKSCFVVHLLSHSLSMFHDTALSIP